ncbi:MAG: helix-turn-helix domain-containing protein [Fimbriimonadales bacterium]|nr:helix-turn-helix domain-containing protein [Fimbriimonadales bacterium]
MNLADAIRKAAQGLSPDAGKTVPMPEVLLEARTDAEPRQPEPAHPSSAPEPQDAFANPVATADAKQIASGGAVRLELLLTPEQLANLLKNAVANHHSVMTLREAASYLRLHSRKLQEMAENGEVPGLLVDGRWRFLKTKLDEWIEMRARKARGDSHAA